MSTKRLVDGVLIVLAVLVLGAGVVYWFVAAPAPQAVGGLQAVVEEQMPVVEDSELLETVTLVAPAEANWPVRLHADRDYRVDVVCAGDGFIEILLPGSLMPMVCTPTGHQTSSEVEGQGADTAIGVRVADGGPVVVAVQVSPV